MIDDPKIRSLLPLRTVRALERGGITTIKQIKESYPKKLARLQGFGLVSLRAVEAAFFNGKKYVPRPIKLRKGKKIPNLSEELAAFLLNREKEDYDTLK